MHNFLFARLSLSPTCERSHQLAFLLRNAYHIFNSFSTVLNSSESALSEQKQEKHESLTVSYFVNSSGLSPKVASEIDASGRIKLKEVENANSVLRIFQSFGFSEIQISKALRNHPRLLRMKPKNLLPKLRVFDSFGLSRSELPEILSSSSGLLKWNLEKTLIPRIETLKSVLANDPQKLTLALRRSGWIFLQQDTTNVALNMKVLREHGVPQSSITTLVANYAGLAFMEPAKFAENVKFAMEIGIEPHMRTLVHALFVLAGTKKSTWKSKLDAFERLGWSKDMTLSVFRKYPFCMKMSEDNIANSIKFFVDEMGLTFEDIATFPALLGYRLKQRIVPRWSVVKTLKRNGLLRKHVAPDSVFGLTEREFLEKFVIRFLVSCPQLLKIYEVSKASVPEVQ